jgi:hypothetical protein
MTPIRRWIRSVSHLSVLNSGAVEKEIADKLKQAYPTEQYPFDILVAYTWVHITDYSGINEKQTVSAAIDRDKITLVLEAVERITRNLKSQKQRTK